MQENKRENSIFKERIIEYLEKMGISKYECYKNTGMSRSVLSQTNGMTEDNLLKFLAYYKGINPTWLLTGEGEMLKSDNSTKDVLSLTHKKNDIAIDTIQEYIPKNVISIPIVDVSAAAGHGFFNPDHPETLGELSFPANLLRKKHGNYYCGRVNGESMAPTLLNQDFIIFRLLQFDEWISIKDNEVYFIVDRSGTSCVKRVKNQLKKGKTILCMSDNLDKTNFRDFTIPGEEIANIYHVEWRFSKDMTDINKTFFSRVDDIEDRLKNVENLLKKR